MHTKQLWIQCQVNCTPRSILGRHVTIYLPTNQNTWIAFREVEVYVGICEFTTNVFGPPLWYMLAVNKGQTIGPHTWWLFFVLQQCHILTHWSRVKYICVSKQIIIGSDNGLAPDRCQAIIRTSAGILSIRTAINEILNEIHAFSFKKMHFEMSSVK